MEAAIELPAELSSPARARRFAEEIVAELGVRELDDTVVLLVSELVTNAVVHAHSPSTLRLSRDERVLRVELYDASSDQATVARQNGHRQDGRGLLLVEALADGWGTEASVDGKVVWFELALPPVG